MVERIVIERWRDAILQYGYQYRDPGTDKSSIGHWLFRVRTSSLAMS